MILEMIKETVQVLQVNKFRTTLTGLTVAWGIFMLISLLGYANGLIHGFNDNMTDGSEDAITLYQGFTTMEWHGYQAGRFIRFTEGDVDDIVHRYSPEKVDHVTFCASRDQAEVKTMADHINTLLVGVFPNQITLDGQQLQCGRYVNDADVRQHRKVAVLSQRVSSILFRNNQSAIGKSIIIDGLVYSVVGVVERKFNSGNSSVIIPASVFLSVYGSEGQISSISFLTKGLNTEQKNQKFEEELRSSLARLHHFNPVDKAAVWIRNVFLRKLENDKARSALVISAWVIGLLSLISGVVGVSNIMFISVKERTHEIGVRRAIGAKPRSIYFMVMMESVFITTLFGYFGMVAGVATNQLVGYYASKYAVNGMGFSMFNDPTVGLDIAIEATITMIVAGILAGLLPALKATRVRPVEALMEE